MLFFWCNVWMWDEEARRNPVPALAYSYRKTPRGPPGYQQSISFTVYTLRNDFEFNSGIFGREPSDWGSSPPCILIPVAGRNLKFLPCKGSNPRHWLCFCTTAVEITQKVEFYVYIVHYSQQILRQKHKSAWYESP